MAVSISLDHWTARWETISLVMKCESNISCAYFENFLCSFVYKAHVMVGKCMELEGDYTENRNTKPIQCIYKVRVLEFIVCLSYYQYILSLCCDSVTYLKWWRNIKILVNWERHLVINVVYKLVPLGPHSPHRIVHGDLMVAVASKHSPCVMCRLWVHKEVTFTSCTGYLCIALTYFFSLVNIHYSRCPIPNSCWDGLVNYLSPVMVEVTFQWVMA